MKNILLIGETGNGKSSLGNYIIGENFFKVTDDPLSCTKEVVGKISKIDKNIFVIDTPGFQDSNNNDKKNFDKVLDFIIKKKNLELILLILNFNEIRFSIYIKNFIKFLCNVFPKNFAHHVGIAFTHYDHDYQTKKNKKKNKDPREIIEKRYVPEIMKLISQTTNEEYFSGPPVFFLDSIVQDDNSNNELNRLIYFTKTLSSIEIFQKKDLFIKDEFYEYDERIRTYEEDDEIITKTEYYKRKKQIYYDGTINYGDWIYYDYDKKTEKKKKIVKIKENEDKFNLLDIIALGFFLYKIFTKK